MVAQRRVFGHIAVAVRETGMFGIQPDGNLSLLKGGKAVGKPSLQSTWCFGVETQNPDTPMSLMLIFCRSTNPFYCPFFGVFFIYFSRWSVDIIPS